MRDIISKAEFENHFHFIDVQPFCQYANHFHFHGFFILQIRLSIAGTI